VVILICIQITIAKIDYIFYQTDTASPKLTALIITQTWFSN